MNPVLFSPLQPDAAGNASSVAAEKARHQPGRMLLSQRLGQLQAKITPPVSDPDFSPVATDLAELQAQLQEARESIVEWARAELGWKGQRRLFKMMTDHVSDLIAVVDGQGNRVWNNPAYSHLLGYPSDQLAGTHVLSEVHEEDKERATAALDEALQTGAMQQVDFRARQKDGGLIDLQTRLAPLCDAAGRIESIVFVAHDVTEKRRIAESLAQATSSATTAGVIEGMARDLDQILTGAFGNLSIAKNLNGAQNAVAVRLNEIERALQRARDLLEQMGSISGHPDQPRVQVALEPVVQEAVGSVLRGTLVRAEYLFPRRLPEVAIDIEAFSLALRNIVTNSVQAMDKGVVRISAEFLSKEQVARTPQFPLRSGGYVHLTIQDQGHGMSEKTLAHAFEPYFTTRAGAQGLGLATALSSVQRLGGTIVADSTPGVGTSVHVYLPAAGTAAPQPAMTGTSALPGVAAKKRILLMDDEQMILDIVGRMLSHLGYEVKNCLDGAQAIAAFTKAKNQGEPFDLVIMDLVIPKGLGGQDAVHTIRKIDPGAKVIASSGHLDHPVMMEHKKFGFIGALEKPYKLDRLQQVIQDVIESGS